MKDRKTIKLRYGKIGELARIFGCTRMTVNRALHWHTDSDLENKIRRYAIERNFVSETHNEE